MNTSSCRAPDHATRTKAHSAHAFCQVKSMNREVPAEAYPSRRCALFVPPAEEVRDAEAFRTSLKTVASFMSGQIPRWATVKPGNQVFADFYVETLKSKVEHDVHSHVGSIMLRGSADGDDMGYAGTP